MCLVSYVPLRDKEFVLTSNRDEYINRASTPIHIERGSQSILAYPQDHKGGSWLMLSHQGRLGCILNGAYRMHKPAPPYRKSRGLILRELFEYPNLKEFLQHVNLSSIEPFTMILMETDTLLELRWDGDIKHIHRLSSSEIHVWSSCTLYTPEQQELRELHFRNHELHPVTQSEDLLEIHQSPSIDDERTSFIMQIGDEVKTVSITQVHISDDRKSLLHRNLLDQSIEKYSF